MIIIEQSLMSCLLLLLLFQSCVSIYTITFNHSISDGDVLVSNGKNFVLGFFSPGSSSNRYVGIWYNKVSEKTVVWVANRDNPINNTAGILSITEHGNLLLSARDIVFWSSNVSDSSMKNCVAELQDTGNLVLVQSTTRNVIWQSFDYPTDTFLPNMKIGVNQRTGFNWFITSWKSLDDPGTGNSSYKFEVNGYPQMVLYKGPHRLWRSGPWYGHILTGMTQMTQNFINYSLVDNGDELYVTYRFHNTLIISRTVVNESGSIQRLSWKEGERRWIGYCTEPEERCDKYGRCGANGICNPYTEDYECTCLSGYKPKSSRDWNIRDASKGCVRKRAEAAVTTCGKGDGFVKVAFAKVPDTLSARVERNLSLKACEEECLRNCTCRAYASADNIRGDDGSGCVSWHGDLMDTRVYSEVGQDLFIRVDAVELAPHAKKPKSKKRMVEILVVSIVVMLLLVISLLYWLVSRKRAKQGQPSLSSFEDSPRANELDGRRSNSDLTFFDLSTIAAVTDNFSPAKKLGQGGFGAVYKGQLLNGREIAVKRLLKNSGQGIEEFKNEVRLIAKLQHRNLVRLLGCCIKKEEKILIYEYLPNKSLDLFIFDETRRSLLDWRKRLEIICGIARGILYLHQDSRLRIIHRDLKASNVLLDAELNPKISDFGLARMFGGDQIEGNTDHVVGTFGYMSPEYAMEGLFSIKSDVFSFGVLLIEIITGRKNSGSYHESSTNLIGHVWDLWREGTSLKMVDSSLDDSYPANEVLRSIQIGLLCVQESATDRPTMSEVVSMLGNDTSLPSPKKPAFIVRRGYNSVDPSTSSRGTSTSVNQVTITSLGGR